VPAKVDTAHSPEIGCPHAAIAAQASAAHVQAELRMLAARIANHVQAVSIRMFVFLLVRALIVGSLTCSSSEQASASEPGSSAQCGLRLPEDDASLVRDAPAMSGLSALRGGAWGVSPELVPPGRTKCRARGGSGGGGSCGVDLSLPLTLKFRKGFTLAGGGVPPIWVGERGTKQPSLPDAGGSGR